MLGSILVGCGIALLVACIIAKLICDKKAGKGCCSGGCGSCKKCHK